MLAIGRALLLNPRLLVMDEPTEGLAPVIVEQVAQAMLKTLAADGEIAVLLIEQNLGVAIEVADTHRRDGQRPHRAHDAGGGARGRPRAAAAAARRARRRRRRGRRADRRGAGAGATPTVQVLHGAARRDGDGDARARRPAPAHRARLHALERRRRAGAAWPTSRARPPPRRPRARPRAGDGRRPRSSSCRWRPAAARAAYVAGTFDTKGRELFFLRKCLEKLGLRIVTVDLATSGKPSPAMRASARGGAPPSAGRARGVHRRPRQRGDRDGASPSSTSSLTRRDLGGLISRRRLGRHRAGHAGRCARCRSACPR